ncbi:MAG TPA: CBS domain-containing protein [Gammaproteobacteria bacterium]|nr:CBS domain-containing protein [Gammaproteobacteria bacterium]
MLARDVMTTDFHSLKPDIPLHKALEPLWQIHHFEAPVVEDGRLVGMVNIRNLVRQSLPRYLLEAEMGDVSYAPDLHQVTDRMRAMGRKTVREVMVTHYRKVSADTALFAVAALLMKEDTKEAHNVAVVDDNGRLEGLISEWDILRHVFGQLDFDG